MKQNTFYLLAGIVGLIEVGIFWLSVEYHNPLLIVVSIIVGISLLYWARSKVTDRKEDERTALISQKSALRTLEVFWVIFFAISLGGAVIGLRCTGISPAATPAPGGGADSPRQPGISSDAAALPDDLPVCRLQDVLRPAARGVGLG